MFPLQIPPLKLAGVDTHGVLQSAGCPTIIEVEQVPKAAVMVTFEATGILNTVLPNTTPADAVIVAPAVLPKATL